MVTKNLVIWKKNPYTYRWILVRSSSFCRTCCVQKLFWMSETISVHNMFSQGLSLEFSWIELAITWTICHHIDAKKGASDKDLPVTWVKLSVHTYFHLLCSYNNVINVYFFLWPQMTTLDQNFFLGFLIGAVLTKLLLSGGNMEVHWSSRNWHVLVWH